jgi:hypothetical protein
MTVSGQLVAWVLGAAAVVALVLVLERIDRRLSRLEELLAPKRSKSRRKGGTKKKDSAS